MDWEEQAAWEHLGMVNSRNPHTGFGSRKGCRRWHGGTWSVGMVAMGV